MREDYKKENKPKLSRLDPAFLEEMAILQVYGDEKHNHSHWMSGVPVEELLDAIRRHANQIQRGEYYDGESGKSHAIHIANCAMYIAYYVRHIGLYSELFPQQYAGPAGARRYLAERGLPESILSGRFDQVSGGGGGAIQEPDSGRNRGSHDSPLGFGASTRSRPWARNTEEDGN